MGFIKKLFGGILGFLQNLFGGKKSEAKAANPAKTKGYFMEFEDSTNGKSADAKPVAAKAPEAKTPAPAKAPEPKKPEPVAVGAPASKTDSTPEAAQPEAAKAEPKSKKTSIKAKKAQSESAANSAPTEVKQPEPEPQPVALQKKTVASKPDSISTFAPTYLNPTLASTGGRRRPGPSMNPFMDMARQVKTPKAKA